jgi:hypothetical protein
MRLFSTSSAALIAACLSTSALAQGSEYECTVVGVLNFSDDTEFTAKNMRKRFLIMLDSERVYVTALSDDFENSQKIYTIVNRDDFSNDVYAISLSSISIDTIAISENSFEGSYNTTLIRQSTLGATVWKLDCQIG